MISITDPTTEKYIYDMLPERDVVLRAMEEQARKRDIPIVGPAVARVFSQLAQIARAKTVFEMGSAIGYSTIWWARAVGEDGRVVYTDGSQKNADEAWGYFERAGVAGRIEVRVGDALEILSEEKPASYDIIFNDVDKQDYPRVLPLARERLRKGGLFITDNVLWSGFVARAVADPKAAKSERELSSETTRGIILFNKMLSESKEFFTTILPLRDGVAVALRI